VHDNGVDKPVKIIQVHDDMRATHTDEKNNQKITDDQPIEDCKFQHRPPFLFPSYKKADVNELIRYYYNDL
jgi:hypothetical protein